tara:strand:- start:5101 stop:5349 length:249 start_codon:yes stop_codon:yes gene_type:complete
VNSVEQQDTSDGTPVKPRRSRVRLDTVSDARREAARIYRKAVCGDLKVEDASRLVNMLAIIGRMVSDGDFEKRLEALERGET